MKRIEFEDALVIEPAKVSILDEMPVGSIVQYGGTNAPAGWLICDGSTISRTKYVDLFNAISTSYGVGDGSTTFNLPNLKGRVAVGLDTNDEDFNELGKTGGEKKHTLTIDEMPAHNHVTGGPSGNRANLTGDNWSNQAYDNQANIATSTTGGNQSHNILQPYAVINYIIKAVQNTRDFNITDAVTDGGTDLNKDTFNGMQDNVEEACNGVAIWKNNNPSNEFSPQALDLDLSDYDMVKIWCRHSRNDITSVDFNIIKGHSRLMQFADYDLALATRLVTISDSSIIFEKGQYFRRNDTDAEEANGRIVPIYIIAYKTGLFE